MVAELNKYSTQSNPIQSVIAVLRKIRTYACTSLHKNQFLQYSTSPAMYCEGTRSAWRSSEFLDNNYSPAKHSPLHYVIVLFYRALAFQAHFKAYFEPSCHNPAPPTNNILAGNPRRPTVMVSAQFKFTICELWQRVKTWCTNKLSIWSIQFLNSHYEGRSLCYSYKHSHIATVGWKAL